MLSIENSQLQLVYRTKKFLSNFNNKFYPKRNNIFYLSSYATCIGQIILKNLKKTEKILFADLSVIIKDILYSTYYSNFKVHASTKLIKKYKRIVISWSFKKNFEKNGSFNDRYFNINSRAEPKTLWYLIYLDTIIPRKIDKNIVIFQPFEKKSFHLSIIIKILFKNFNFILRNVKYFLSKVSSYSFFAEVVGSNFILYLNENVKYILMPYEGQPFQNEIINLAKNYNKKINIIGYIHSPPVALPTNFIFKYSSPDKIILNGKDQLECFNKLLGWKKKNIKLLPSDRFLKSSKNLSGNIFLPIAIKSKNTIIKSFNYLINKKFINLKNFKIKNHPAAQNSKINLDLISEIKKIIRKNKIKLKPNKRQKLSIFIGASGAIIEALERNTSVVHICEDPIFDMYSKKIWPSIKSEKITENIFKYSLVKKGKLIRMGNRSKNLNHYF